MKSALNNHSLLSGLEGMAESPHEFRDPVGSTRRERSNVGHSYVAISEPFPSAVAINGWGLPAESVPFQVVSAPVIASQFFAATSLSHVISSSITNVGELMSGWGFDEGIGRGDLPVVGSCGCGQCPLCSGSGGSGRSNFFPNAQGVTLFVNLDQVVFLDFDSGTDANINYTSSIRNSIQAQMELVYQRFGVTFVQQAPTEGDFSTIIFNRGNPGGRADDIDFRNLNKNDNAVVNIQGFGITNTETQIIFSSANIAAHELGHILGLRHHDAFGAIGMGIPSNVNPGRFSPRFPGLTQADETRRHIMNTPAIAGNVVDVLQQNWFGEREAIKLAFAVLGTTVMETVEPNDTFEQAQMLVLPEMQVPNTIVEGVNANTGDFTIEALSVVGSIDAGDPGDFYMFQGRTNRVYSFEVISNATRRYSDVNPIDPIIRIYDSSFTLVDYFGTPAINDDDVEFSFDSHLFDLFLPQDGLFFIEVDTFSANDTGFYELFVQSFVAVPFGLPTDDDFGDSLIASEAHDLVFSPLSGINIGRISGTIGFLGTPVERDVFNFTIHSTAKVTIDVRAQTPLFDSFVELYNSNQELIAFNDNAENPNLQNPTDSQLIVKNLAPGDYFAVVSGASSTTGNYNLAVRHNGIVGNRDDHGNSFAAATNLDLQPLPQTTFVNAEAELGFDNDFFRFTALATGQVIVRSLALSGDLNTVLRAYDNNRNLVDSNNNFGGTLNSKIAFQVFEGASYFVRLSTVGDTTGQYRLSLRTVPGPGVNPSPNGWTAPGFDPNVNLTLNGGDYSDNSLAGSAFDSQFPPLDQFWNPDAAGMFCTYS